ncbi:MAG: hypothetical protein OSB46_04360 [Alphaproteobacteria bacterium]|nr:hypothetical protein [Alphaproteobacteria bacterium]
MPEIYPIVGKLHKHLFRFNFSYDQIDASLIKRSFLRPNNFSVLFGLFQDHRGINFDELDIPRHQDCGINAHTTHLIRRKAIPDPGQSLHIHRDITPQQVNFILRKFKY